jgi:hypothetical protein
VRMPKIKSQIFPAECEATHHFKLQHAAGLAFFLFISFLFLNSSSFALESGTFRLLSVADSGKLILVSKIPNKTKYMLDATTAKITLNGKPAEFTDLKMFSVIQVKMELRKSSKEGIDIDGLASEIKITAPQSP